MRRFFSIRLINWLALMLAHVSTVSASTGAAIHGDDVMQWAMSLLLVLVTFVLCVWLMKKSHAMAAGGGDKLQIVTGLSVGMREKILLVKVGEKQLLLGVTAGRIEKLMELEGEQRLALAEITPSSAAFGKKIIEALTGKNNAPL